MVQTSELDPMSILVEGWADRAKCSMEDFCHPAPGTRDLQVQGLPSVVRCIFYYRLSQQIASISQHNSLGALFSRRVEAQLRGTKIVASPLLPVPDRHDVRFPATAPFQWITNPLLARPTGPLYHHSH